jgi:cation/acetate symporter
VVAVLRAGIPAAALALGINDDTALAVLLALILLCALRGGTYGTTATQIGQYIAIIVSGIALFLMLEINRFGALTGRIYDPLVEALEAIMRGLGLSPALSPRSVPFRWSDAVENLQLVLCLMTGTAALPHVLVRPLTTPSMGKARNSAA